MAIFNKELNRYEWTAPAEGSFDWSPYENGWNGKSLKVNSKVKTKKGDKVYNHETSAQDVYNSLAGIKVSGSKELKKNNLVCISDINTVDNNTVMITINGGANNVVVDLNKENQFFNLLNIEGSEEKINKSEFVYLLNNSPKFKSDLLGMNLNAKITAGDVEKASIWDGYVETLEREMREQIVKNAKAYWATIISTNKGGFVVDIMNTVKAFMPGSMAAANRVTDFEAMVGTKFEVMVESWDPTYGFVVSRKKFLKTMLPVMIARMEDTLDDNKDTVFTGHVTGSTQFGVFVEIDEFITGMLHKTLVSDETREAMRNNSIAAGTEVQVYVHNIEKTKVRENGKLVERFRVILSDVPSSERDAVISRREAEEAEDKKAAVADNQ